MVSAAEEYLESRVMTAPPERLHLIVVEAALRFARIGSQALRDRKYDRSFAALSKARDCVNELMCSIQGDAQPELANQLKSLFFFCHRSLIQADFEHEPRHADDAIRVLEIHRETWLELIGRLGQSAAPTSSSPQVASGVPGGNLAPASGLGGRLSNEAPPPPRRPLDSRFDDDLRPGLDLTS
jgi:flagellar secretion chaperone FliS